MDEREIRFRKAHTITIETPAHYNRVKKNAERSRKGSKTPTKRPSNKRIYKWLGYWKQEISEMKMMR